MTFYCNNKQKSHADIFLIQLNRMKQDKRTIMTAKSDKKKILNPSNISSLELEVKRSSTKGR